MSVVFKKPLFRPSDRSQSRVLCPLGALVVQIEDFQKKDAGSEKNTKIEVVVSLTFCALAYEVIKTICQQPTIGIHDAVAFYDLLEIGAS